MKSRRNLWTLHNVASAYGCRPSSILEVEDGWAAYQLDLACLLASREVERLTTPGEDGAPGLDVEEVLGDATQPSPRGEGLELKRLARRFADPRVKRMGKAAVPESGVW